MLQSEEKENSSNSQCAAPNDPRRLGLWIEASAAALGLDAEPAEVCYADLERVLSSAAPAILRLSDGTLLALLSPRKVLAPDFSVQKLSKKAIRTEICQPYETPLESELTSLLESANIPKRRHRQVLSTLLQQRLANKRVAHVWLLRLPPGASFRRSLSSALIPQHLAALGAAYLAQYVLWLTAWWIIGAGALSGRLDRTLLVAWLLLLMTLVPLRGLVTWLQGIVSITAGGLLKERLLAGALRLHPSEIRIQGAGQLLGQVLESESLEALALSGGFLALVASIELALSAIVLAYGAGGIWHALLLVLWVALATLLGIRYFQQQRRWTASRLAMTHDLLERMVGHRTRLVQEPREQWHRAEDQQLEHYQAISRDVDRKAALLSALVPRGWLILGTFGLAQSFVAGSSPSALALGVAGLLLAYRAFRRLSAGLWSLSEAAIAAQQVAPLFKAAARPLPAGSPSIALAAAEGARQEFSFEATDVTFRYRPHGEVILNRNNLRMASGERILLEGPSGGGKSTLGSVFTGMLTPQSGLLLARGFDRQSLGEQAWRRYITAAPQFHENHVLTGTFAFNLLMGRNGWLTEQDFIDAQTVCQELGLAPLLEKMPAGMLQMVGESGWQLSHGERSRLFMARALLQNADLLIFDESFAALDPENLRLSLDCALRRARTLLVIAHP
jgi:ATP-binding cassette subfamily B protein